MIFTCCISTILLPPGPMIAPTKPSATSMSKEEGPELLMVLSVGHVEETEAEEASDDMLLRGGGGGGGC